MRLASTSAVTIFLFFRFFVVVSARAESTREPQLPKRQFELVDARDRLEECGEKYLRCRRPDCLLPARRRHREHRDCTSRDPKVVVTSIEDGLSYHWSFDDGDAIDSVREVEGQIVGGVQFEEGVLGKAAFIKNDSTRIVVQSPALDLDGWKQVTLSMWVKMNRYSTYGRAISWAEGNQTCGLALHVGGDCGYWVAGAFYAFLEDGSYLHVRPETFKKNATPYPRTGVWYHLVGTYDGKRIRFYTNGKLDGERLAETPGLRIRDLPNARLVIGRAAPSPKYDHWRDTYFPGFIDEVKIWSKALSRAEVRSLYRKTLRKSGTGSIGDQGTIE